MDGKKSDIIVTDPPYNVNYQGVAKTRAKIANDNLSDEAFEQFLQQFYTLTAAQTKKGAAWYVFHSDVAGHTFRNEMKRAGISLKQCLIWVKQHFVLGRQDYQWQHEPILYG
jgi:site-specific DNA-methyltransferase (adenine-specific)